MSMTYHAYLKSPRWRLIRALRRWLSGGRCATCHATRRLQAHHASYKNVNVTWWGVLDVAGMILELGDTILLCDACHEGVHSQLPIREFAD